MLVSEPVEHAHPSEAGVTFSLRRLSWLQLREARRAREREQQDLAKGFGAEFVMALQAGNVDEDAARRVLETDPYELNNFDLGVLLAAGIADWSYDVPVDEDHIGQLDEQTAVWAGQAIIDLTRPPTGDASKNS